MVNDPKHNLRKAFVDVLYDNDEKVACFLKTYQYQGQGRVVRSPIKLTQD